MIFSDALVPTAQALPHSPLCFARQAIGASLILEIVTANSKYSSLFTKLLSEDKIAGEDSYIDFLCWIHKEIQIGAAS